MDAITIKAATGNSIIPMAVVVDGISERWGMNVLQILACPSSAQITIEGHGAVSAPALVLSKRQARDLARRILEMLGG
jgi:hypothetical protein